MIEGTAARFWMLTSISRFHQRVAVGVLLEVDRGGDADRDDEARRRRASAHSVPMSAGRMPALAGKRRRAVGEEVE